MIKVINIKKAFNANTFEPVLEVSIEVPLEPLADHTMIGDVDYEAIGRGLIDSIIREMSTS